MSCPRCRRCAYARLSHAGARVPAGAATGVARAFPAWRTHSVPLIHPQRPPHPPTAFPSSTHSVPLVHRPPAAPLAPREALTKGARRSAPSSPRAATRSLRSTARAGGSRAGGARQRAWCGHGSALTVGSNPLARCSLNNITGDVVTAACGDASDTAWLPLAGPSRPTDGFGDRSRARAHSCV